MQKMIDTHLAGSLVEKILLDAGVKMRGTGFNLLAESRLKTPRGLGATLESLPPKIQCGGRIFYHEPTLTKWVKNVLIPHLELDAILEVIGNKPPKQKSEELKIVQVGASEPFNDKEKFLGELVSQSFKFADQVIRNNSFDKSKYGGALVKNLRSEIALDVIQSATWVNIKKEFQLTHAH